jgi:signal transduction histidine kinase
VLLYLNGYAHFFSDAASQFILVHAHTFIAVGFIATIYFNNQFLNLKKHLPKSIPFFNFLVFMWICLLVVSLWDTRSLTNRAAQILVFVNSIAVLYVSLRIGKKLRETKNPFVLCYIIGWMPICLTTIYVVFTLIEVLPFEDFTLKLLTGAGILEATLISLALLGDRFRLLRKDKEKAEQMSIQLVKERNIFLEQKIDERTKELQVANDKLKESNEFKDKLFSIIAHDMRTPLSSLKGVLQLVEENVLDAEQLNDFLVQIRKNTEQVQQTMDNLLNWAISQMNMQRYEPESINLKAFVCEHLAIYEHLAKNKEITTYIDCPNEIIVYADKNQLSLIVRNLIDNAIKFTLLKGTIHIDLKIINNRAHFCISNTGKPLSAQAIAKILDAETLTTSYGTAEEKGTGLGLQLCKEFIKNMNSSLKIESSDLENGTNIKFSFEIPLQ